MDTRTMFDGQRLPFKVAPVDAQGRPSEIEAGSLVGIFDDAETMLTCEIGADGLSGYVHVPAGAPVKTTVFTLSADADLGEGVETISVSVEIEVQHRKAANLGASFGEPEDEPAV